MENKDPSVDKSQEIRQAIYHTIENITPYDSIEAAHLQETMQWIKNGCPLFRVKKPHVPDPHLVAYCVLVDPQLQKILLVDHKKSNLWLPSGGHADPNEHPRETAKREFQEELNTSADFLFSEPLFLTRTVAEQPQPAHTDISLWYVFKGCANKKYDYDTREFHGVRWFDFHAVPFEKSDPHMKRFIGKLENILQK